MRLFHGTSGTRALKIMETGILPRSKLNTFSTMPLASNRTCTYLCDHPSYYAHLRSYEDNCGTAGIIEVDTSQIPVHLLAVDDAACEEAGRGVDGLDDDMSINARRVFYADWAIQNSADFPYQDGLEVRGSIAVKGSIPVSAITRVAIMDIHIVRPFFDPPISTEVTVQTYRHFKKKYATLTRWIFGEAVNLKHVMPWEETTYKFPPDVGRTSIQIYTPSTVEKFVDSPLDVVI